MRLGVEVPFAVGQGKHEVRGGSQRAGSNDVGYCRAKRGKLPLRDVCGLRAVKSFRENMGEYGGDLMGAWKGIWRRRPKDVKAERIRAVSVEPSTRQETFICEPRSRKALKAGRATRAEPHV